MTTPIMNPVVFSELLLEQAQHGPNRFDVLAGFVNRLRTAGALAADFFERFLELSRHDA
jgi:hypothetical protein